MHRAAVQRVQRTRSYHHEAIAQWRSKYHSVRAEFEQTEAQLRGLEQQAFDLEVSPSHSNAPFVAAVA